MHATPAARRSRSVAHSRDRRSVSPARLAFFGLIALLIVLQYPLWFGSGGAFAVWELRREIAAQRAENARLAERNHALAADVIDLKQGLAAIEERARMELGMIRKGETFYQIIDGSPDPGSRPPLAVGGSEPGNSAH